jgi:Na+-transporting NADH:ubiquinone oxidoreductase subunit C
VPQSSKQPSTLYTYVFMVALCFGCALVLSVLASVLRTPQEEARKLDRSKQMLSAAMILSNKGHFLLNSPDGSPVPAKHAGDGALEPGAETDLASPEDILEVFAKRIKAVLISKEGQVRSFQDSQVDPNDYIEENAKRGYANLPLKLAYQILPNPTNGSDGAGADGYIIPVNGMGLWDRIYGYLAIKPDGDEVINIAWYEHAETPGLGANIANPLWQSQFPGKRIFQKSPDGSTNRRFSPLGITVRRGKVADELGDSPKAQSAVDGMAGATLTGVGVSKAYKDSLGPYRPFLINLSEGNQKSGTL